MPSQVSLYPNQGYYVLYPMARQLVGIPTQLSFTQWVSQQPWSQHPNSAYQASYAEIIKGAEKFCAIENLLNHNIFKKKKIFVIQAYH